jgi:biotin carboxyl carrier protein
VTPDDPRWTRALSQTLREVAAARTPARVAAAVEALLLDQLGEPAHCWFFDAESGLAWAPDDTEPDPDVAAAARARQTLVVGPHVLQPVGGDEVHAVLSVHGTSPAGIARLGALARQLAPLLEHHTLLAELEVSPSEGPFRAEALEAHQSWQERGEPLQLRAAWTPWTYCALLSVLGAALLYASVARVGDWSSGPAVVRLIGRREVTAALAATVTAVEVSPGERVVAGQPLVRLDDGPASAELARIGLAFELQLRNLLHDPGDPAAQQAVTALRADRARALADLEAYVLRAPTDTVVADVRASVGQVVAPGDVVVSLRGDGERAELVALLPGDERPRIRAGMELRLEVDGYAHGPATASVERVEEDVVGSAEAMRLLGSAGGDLPLSGPVTLVHAELPVAFGGYTLHDGMRGQAEVRVRSTSVLAALVPALERLGLP